MMKMILVKSNLYVDGVKTAAQFQNNGSTYTTVITSADLTLGEHSITVKAIDGYQAEGVSNTITVNVLSEMDILKILRESSRENIEENLIFVAELLDVNLTQYLGLSNKKKETVLLELLGKSFSSAEELQNFLKSMIDELDVERVVE